MYRSSSKYHAVKTQIDGITFDSKREANRYQELKLLERAGQIKDLQLQVPFTLIPSQKDEETGKTLERAVTYKADFVYKEKLDIPFSDAEKWETVVEDVKGMRTDVYKIKRKLMLKEHGIRIREV